MTGTRIRGVAAAAVCACALGVPSQAAAEPFLRGFAEPGFTHPNAEHRDYWYDQAVRAGGSVARINVPWSKLVSGKPANPADPADPAYDLSAIDAGVVDAADRGVEVVLTVYSAPGYAEGPNVNADAPAGTWKPDPDALGEFAQALATRYSGSFSAPGGGPLPAVGYMEAWNEPNLSEYITPQYSKKRAFAPRHYREMLNAFYAGVQRSGGAAKVVTGGTAPYGDPQGGRRTRPLEFLRELFCLDNDLKKSCKKKAKFDILAHHPITLSGGPNRSAIHRDDAAMPDFKHVVRTLRAAERHKTAVGAKRHPAWATEFWWESNPPDPKQGVPVAKHARWIQNSLYSLYRQGADAAIWLLLRDRPFGPDGVSEQQSGLFFLDRTEKPAFTAFRFPFVVERKSKRKVNAWTIPPTDGSVEIQVEGNNGFSTAERIDGQAGEPLQTKVKLKGKGKLRAVVNGEASLVSGVG
jgi:hypothetical protein